MKIRCSSIGKIMTGGNGITEKQLITLNTLKAKEKRTDKQQETLQELINKRDTPPPLSETTKKYCLELYAESLGRRRDIQSKYLSKGIAVEDDSITLLSMLTNKFYTKNTKRYNNAFITGEPDLVPDQDELDDIKSSWDLVTFLNVRQNPTPDPNYYGQLQGYMELTGRKRANLRYCLVNATPTLIDDEKRRLFYQCGDTESQYYKDGCKQIERNMIFDLPLFMKQNPYYDLSVTDWSHDIPMQSRLHTITIDYDPEYIKKVYARVERVREFIKESAF